MKCPKSLAVVALTGLLGTFTLQAGDPPTVDTSPAVPDLSGLKSKLPEITPNGVISLFGKKQVLFKVTGQVQSDGSAGDSSCVLEVGERQDGIEVLAVDDESKMVTFNNHGTVQKIALQTAALVSAPVPVQPATMTLQTTPLQSVTPAAPPVEEPQNNGGGVTIITIGSRPAAPATHFKHQLGFAAPGNQNQIGGAGFPPPVLPANQGAAGPANLQEAPPPIIQQEPLPATSLDQPGMGAGTLPH